MTHIMKSLASRLFLLSTLCLIVIAALMSSKPHLASGLVVGGDASTSESPTGATAKAGSARGSLPAVRTVKTDNPWIKLQDGRALKTQYRPAVENLGQEQEMTLGQAMPLSLASGDLNGDGFPDLVTGFAGTEGGIVTLRLGNPEAFSPTKQATIRGVAQGQFPDAFLSDALTLPVTAAADFIGVGDFNGDGNLDVIAASRGGGELYLLAGDGHGGLGLARAISLPGLVTAMITGELNQPDGKADIGLGIEGNNGPQVLVYSSAKGALSAKPVAYPLQVAATALAIGQLDDDAANDLAAVAGGQVLILHGRTQSAASRDEQSTGRVETLSLPFTARSLAVGEFIWDREARQEIAVLSDDGGMHIVARGELDIRPYSAEEVRQRRLELEAARQAMAAGRTPNQRRQTKALKWSVAEDLPASASIQAGGNTPAILVNARLSALPTDDLLVMNPSQGQFRILYRPTQQSDDATASSMTGRSAVELKADGEPVAVLPVRVSVDSRPGLVMLSKGSASPIMMAPLAAQTYHVTGVNADSTAPCVGTNCQTLRAAIIAANANPGADTIVFDANGTFTLSLTSGGGNEDAAASGDLDINDSLTITGNGAANTVISTSYNSSCGDCKVFGVNQDGTHDSLAISITGVTIQNGSNTNAGVCGTFTETGGGVDFFLTGTGNSYSISNSVITNNQTTGCPGPGQRSHGGGINVDSFITGAPGGPSGGTVTFTNLTVSNNIAAREGGGISLAADNHDVTLTNCSVTGNQSTNAAAGGLWIIHSFGGTDGFSGGSISNNTAGTNGGGVQIDGNQVVNFSNTTISGNTATGTGGSSVGGGIAIINLGASGVTGSTSITGSTISNNHADNGGAAAGGGIYFDAAYSASVSNTTISGNSSGNGAGIHNGGSTSSPLSSLTVNGCSITGNTASVSGGGVGNIGVTTVTNSTISGNSASTSGGGFFVGSGGPAGAILTANLNRIAGNTASSGSGIAQTGATASVENNWWGCDGFPNAAGCQTGSGTFDADPRIDLRLTASPTTILTGGSSTLTADVGKNSDGVTINPTVLNGLTITFAGTLGTVSPTTAPLASLMASSTFTATSCGTATVSATLDNGTQAASITINQPPTLSACPSNITQGTDPNQCSAVVTYTAPTATGCPTVTVTCTPPSGSTFQKGTTNVNCTATNGITPDASCSFTVTVNDTQAPTIACPSNITKSTDPDQCSAVVTYTTPTASDNCPGVGAVTCTPASGSTFAKGTTTVNCSVSDAASNTASCSFTVTVNDTQAPTVNCPSNITKSTDPNQCSAVVTYSATANDNCPGATVSCTPPSGSTFAKGVTTVNCTATDTSSNTASCSFTVTVNDTQAPTIVCPTNQSVTANGPTTVNYPNPTVSDNCPGATFSCSPASGSTFPVGTTNVNCTATDTSSNTASCSFTVTVALACTISCPSNIVVNNAPGQCGANVSFAPTATSGCGTVTCSPASGSFFPVGTTTVNCSTATGPSCSFTVTVNDTEAPTITVNPMDIELWPPNHQYETVTMSQLVTSVTDNCGGSIPISSVIIAKVSSDEAENGPDDGNTINDIVIASDCKSVQLRAERQGGGNGRVYTITLQVKDSKNNVRTVTKTVGVPINQSGGPAMFGPGPGYSVMSNCSLGPIPPSFRSR